MEAGGGEPPRNHATVVPNTSQWGVLVFDSWMMPRGDLYHPPAGTLADQRDWMEERVLARLENPSPFGENRLVVLCFTTLEFETRLIFLACFSLNLLSSTKCIQQQPKGDNFTLKCATNLNQILKKM